MKLRPIILTVTALSLATGSACNRGPKRETDDNGSSLDRVSQAPQLAPQPITHGMSKVQKFVKFPFEVPAHVVAPRVAGEFSSFIQGAGGARISDESADVELMIMNEEQYGAFEQKTSAESVYAVEPSHDQEVNITLPSTQDAAMRYYAVFRRTSEGKRPIWVKADLTADFGSP